MHDYVDKNPLNIKQIKDFAGQLISVICYLHNKDILHGDLKPANILMTANHKTIKLTDLGISKIIKQGVMKTKNS